jgi:hypothetical protein
MEKTAATRPTATSGFNPEALAEAIVLAKLGKIGIMIPNPNRSMKMVRNKMAIRLSFIGKS